LYATSATLTWGINGNPAGTTAKVLRLVTGVNTGLTFTTENNSYTDTGLLGCTNYDFLVWNVNKAGINTGYLDVLSVLTANPVPLPPRNFSAQSLAGNQIKLAWGAAPYEGITEYQLFYDNGTGTINYGAPLATVTAVPGVYTYSYTAGGLTTGTVYKFGLQAKHRCGVLETNTNVVASAAALYSLTGVRAAIKQPQGGKTIKGNSITVMAELILGTIAETRDIRFQYKAPGPGGWSDITAKHPAQHPNPTSGWPYLIHWDVHTLPLGSYDLRAVATDNSSSHVVDANPPVITIEIVNSHADIEENENNGAVTTVQEVSNIVPNTVQTAAAGSLTTLSIPATALVETSTSVEVTNNPAYVPPDPADAQPAGVITQITLSGGQTQLANGQTATVMLTYPDVNGDGIVDETSIRASELVMYSAETAAGPWNRDLSSSVDPDNKTVIGNTSHFSFFALFAPTASDLNGVKAFPVPWKPGSNGPFDSNTVPAGITFSGMPGSAEIKIFTITGQLVRNLKLTSAQSSTVWDGKNSAGSKAASGIYLAHIKSGKKVKILKIAVER